ncbi:MAG: LPXTG cell wall anchor domain-containing protein [Anaerolineae bacterium]|nr:LPXTG cell wall anchor domain-containing protein [Anaerolineae bacterium]
MTNQNDNDLEELDFGESSPIGEPQGDEPKSSNKNFLIALGILGGLFILIAAGLVVVVMYVLPARSEARNQALNAQLAANTATAQYVTDEAMKAIIQLTPSATPEPSVTPLLPTPTETLVVAPVASATPTPTTVSDAQKATLSAQQTQLAAGVFTATVIPTSTALPNTGFADEVGLPGLFGLALGLVLIIFLARRLRSSAA